MRRAIPIKTIILIVAGVIAICVFGIWLRFMFTQINPGTVQLVDSDVPLANISLSTTDAPQGTIYSLESADVSAYSNQHHSVIGESFEDVDDKFKDAVVYGVKRFYAGMVVTGAFEVDSHPVGQPSANRATYKVVYNSQSEVYITVDLDRNEVGVSTSYQYEGFYK